MLDREYGTNGKNIGSYRRAHVPLADDIRSPSSDWMTTTSPHTIALANWSIERTDHLLHKCTIDWNIGPPSGMNYPGLPPDLGTMIKKNNIDPTSLDTSNYLPDLAPKGHDSVTYRTTNLAHGNNLTIDLDDSIRSMVPPTLADTPDSISNNGDNTRRINSV